MYTHSQEIPNFSNNIIIITNSRDVDGKIQKINSSVHCIFSCKPYILMQIPIYILIHVYIYIFAYRIIGNRIHYVQILHAHMVSFEILSLGKFLLNREHLICNRTFKKMVLSTFIQFTDQSHIPLDQIGNHYKPAQISVFLLNCFRLPEKKM